MHLKCKLCHLDTKLCQSHIVPESAYRSLYDEKHRFYEVSNVEQKLPKLQKGLREPLLCSKCEERLNKYDSYFADLWYQNNAGPLDAHQELITVVGIDYHRFKLFHISVLWRAGVASRKEFSAVDLGEHEEYLRRLILSDDPGTPNQYGMFGYVLASPRDRHVYQTLLVQPVAVELNGTPGFHFVFGGCAWHYMLTNGVDLGQHPFLFQEDGCLRLLRVYIDQYDPVMDIVRQRADQGWRRPS